MRSFDELLAMHCEHMENGGTERFGQFFCNLYIKNAWPTLFYASYNIASDIIYNWLQDHQYTEELPEPIDRSKK